MGDGRVPYRRRSKRMILLRYLYAYALTACLAVTE
jgi:hypothetical protein